MEIKIEKYNGKNVVEIIGKNGTYQLCPESSYDRALLNMKVVQRVISLAKAETTHEGSGLNIAEVSGSTNNKEKDCEHEYRSFVDRIDKSKQIFCWKCGKEYDTPYNKRM